MKNMLAALALCGMIFAAAPASAADNEVEITSDKTTNPFTGTVTETKEMKKKRKRADGTTARSEVKETKKTKTDGTVEKKVEEEHSAE